MDIIVRTLVVPALLRAGQLFNPVSFHPVPFHPVPRESIEFRSSLLPDKSNLQERTVRLWNSYSLINFYKHIGIGLLCFLVLFRSETAYAAERAIAFPAVVATHFDYNRVTDRAPRISSVISSIDDVDRAFGSQISVTRSHESSGPSSVKPGRVQFQQPVSWIQGNQSHSTPAGTIHNTSDILMRSPCTSGVGIKLGDTVWRGLRVQSWGCHKHGFVDKTKQLFSTQWQVVVLEEFSNGAVAEARDLSLTRSIPQILTRLALGTTKDKIFANGYSVNEW